MLDALVAKLAALPPQEQDRIAQWLLQELPDEALWDRQFSDSQKALSKLAAETRAERAVGNTTELDPAKAVKRCHAEKNCSCSAWHTRES